MVFYIDSLVPVNMMRTVLLRAASIIALFALVGWELWKALQIKTGEKDEQKLLELGICYASVSLLFRFLVNIVLVYKEISEFWKNTISVEVH